MAPPPPVEAAPARGRYDERAPEPRPHDDRYRDDRYRDDRYRDDRDRYDDDWRRKKSKKKRGFDMLEDLFDF